MRWPLSFALPRVGRGQDDSGTSTLVVERIGFPATLMTTVEVLESGENESARNSLYRLGALAALIAVVVFRRNFGAELMAFGGFGIFDVPATAPTSAVEWFDLLQSDALLGLILFGLFDLINYLLIGLMFLPVSRALWDANQSAILVAVTLAWIGIAIYFTSNQAFSMLDLSRDYATATTAARRSALVAAGEALLSGPALPLTIGPSRTRVPLSMEPAFLPACSCLPWPA